MSLLVLILTLCAILASLRMTINAAEQSKFYFGTNKYINFITHPGWAMLCLIGYIPWLLGAFARGETSANPWSAFQNSYSMHGPIEGLLSSLIVIFVLLWLFWIPSQLYISSKESISSNKSVLIRVVNILVGSILIM